MPQFVVLMREDRNAWIRLPAEQRKDLMVLYNKWVAELKKKDILRGGMPLAPGGRILRGEAGSVSSTRFEEGEQTLTGYFLIDAKDWDEATAIASACPALLHGETVELRKIAEPDAGEH